MKTIVLNDGNCAIVDDGDYESLSKYKWNTTKHPLAGTKYAIRTEKESGVKRTVRMHRVIMRAMENESVDHVDGNGLNNVRSNLRIATITQNQRNRNVQEHSSRFKGVSFHAKYRKWTSYIRVDKKKIHLGTFEDERIAAIEYDKHAILKFGEFARTNNSMGLL